MSEWISVEERLPEIGQNVLLYFSGVGVNPPRMKVDYRVGDFFLLQELYGPVTHWMPLPEPPEVKASK